MTAPVFPHPMSGLSFSLSRLSDGKFCPRILLLCAPLMFPVQQQQIKSLLVAGLSRLENHTVECPQPYYYIFHALHTSLQNQSIEKYDSPAISAHWKNVFVAIVVIYTELDLNYIAWFCTRYKCTCSEVCTWYQARGREVPLG